MLIVSSELDEVIALADRIAVMYRGRFIGIVDRSEADRERLGLMMAGTPLQDLPATGADDAHGRLTESDRVTTLASRTG